MYKIKIAKYKSPKTLFSKLIRTQQRLQDLGWHSQYSHTEILFENNTLLQKLIQSHNLALLNSYNTLKNHRHITSQIESYGVWFSSSERDGGTRFKAINDDKDNWDYVTLVVNREQYIALFSACVNRNGYRYGWLAIIFTQILKTLWFKNKKAPFCSQVTLEVLQSIGLFAGYNSMEVNPGKLSSLCENINEEYNKLNKLYK